MTARRWLQALSARLSWQTRGRRRTFRVVYQTRLDDVDRPATHYQGGIARVETPQERP